MESLFVRTQQVLSRRYPNYSELQNGERVLLAMSVLANDLKVREVGGNNRGDSVKEILASSKIQEGNPWCAASIEFCCGIANLHIGPQKGISAAVLQWKSWAESTGRIRAKATRGRLCFRVKQVKKKGKLVQERHIGIVAGIVPNSGNIISYEGNTSSGATGSQNDGGGLYRRIRKPEYWTGYIELDEPAD